ncbi:MAG: hypothetical protein WC379_03750 [Methanoregula sp.]|jgi:phosphomethylpyrimidine synthase
MSKTQQNPDGDGHFRLASYYGYSRKIHVRDGEMETCPVCGDLCAVRTVNELFGTGSRKKKGKGKI